MLPRILEPEVMDTHDDANDYDAMDHSAVNRIFVEDLLAVGDLGEDILDLGTGTARIPIELCRHTSDCRIMAVDMSISMLELARYNIEVAGVINRVYLDHSDAKQLPQADETFHAVISNSIVHHIPEPLAVLQEAVRVTTPGGLLFFRDLLRPESDDAVGRLVDTYTAGDSERQRKLFEDSVRAALTVDEVRELVLQLGFAPETVQATSDRHWTWCARK